MAATPTTIRSALDRLAHDIASIENRLNQADSRLGDGDTGTMLARMIGVMAQVECNPADTVGAYLNRLAKASARSTGSSFGTLVIAALMAVGRATADTGEIETARVSALFGIAREEMMKRGKAPLGAKTAVDSLARIEAATKGADRDVRARIAEAADAALDAFRDKPCLMGRARMFKDRSIGHDDPGMLAFALIAHALFDAQTTPGESPACETDS